MAARKFQFDFHHGEAAPIGGHQRELVVLETEQDAVEHVAGLIGGNRVGSFAQAVAQIFLPHRDDFGVLELRQRRKFLLRQTENLEETLAAADRRGVFSIDIDLNLARRQFADDVENTPRRKRGRSCLFHLRFASAAHADVQIGGCQMQFDLR